MFDFKQQFDFYQQHVNQFLSSVFVETEAQKLNLVAQAAAYSLQAPGKRLRPIIAIALYEALSGKTATSDIYRLACSLEMVHTFSLIHDDLPALDNDTLRRGLPTCHAQFNEATAILAGDFLLNQAYLNLSTAKIAPELIASLTAVLSRATSQLIIGEQNDLLGEQTPLNSSALRQMFIDKTGAMFSASFAFGALLANAESTVVQSFWHLGTDFGLAFQIQDDVLDQIGDQEILGKNIGSDLAENKSTWVKLFGLESAQEDYLHFYQQGEQKLRQLLADQLTAPPTQFLLALIASLQKRQK